MRSKKNAHLTSKNSRVSLNRYQQEPLQHIAKVLLYDRKEWMQYDGNHPALAAEAGRS